jgi:hypothetical protein
LQKNIKDRIFDSSESFDSLALDVYRYQYTNNTVYKRYCDSIKGDPDRVCDLADIPFLPVQFFKSHHIISDGHIAAKVFESSATSGLLPSCHYVADLTLYEQSYLNCFKNFYGDPSRYCFLALLPSYIERGTSSLLYMADHLIRLSESPHSGFINQDFDDLTRRIEAARAHRQQLFILGVTYALLDYAESHPMDLSNAIMMETGGMKGRREELTRQEVHSRLQTAFSLSAIHSEYGMTELLSQAYSTGVGLFRCPQWMKVLVRDPYDPRAYIGTDRAGALNIIDLANLYSCSFIEVSDMGRVYADDSFEVLGRMDSADIRGCNLMYEI